LEHSSVNTFICQCRDEFRSVCENLQLEFYGEHEGKQCCVLHFPSEHKKSDFEEVLQVKFGREDFDFRGAFFPSRTARFGGHEFVSASFHEATFSGETDFSNAKFSGERTSFHRAKFSGERTSFRRAKFSGEGISFSQAQFSSAVTDFSLARFSGRWTSFTYARFSGERTSFSQAQFSSTETSFRYARFSGAETNFSRATFEEKVAFLGKEKNMMFDAPSWVRFEHCRIDKPELLTFNTVLLRPGWFVNVDVRKVDFTDVKWHGLTDGPKGDLKEEIEALVGHGVDRPYTLLAQACQRLAANAEENRNHAHASEFNYWAMDAQRREQWVSGFAPWRLI
jgi:uncharacterized protein YjbI with pentapeptide repeats